MSVESYLLDHGADTARPSVRAYIAEFMRPESKPRCAATYTPDHECEREAGHPGLHYWRESKREVGK